MNLVNHMNNFVKTIGVDPIDNFNAELSKIPNLIKLTLGEPDFNTPQHIKDAGIQAIEDNHNHYPDIRGIEPLRQNAAKFLSDKYNLHYDPDTQIIATTGVTEGIHCTLSAILNPGDEVIIPTPIFPIYIPNVQVMGAKPILINTESDNYYLTPAKLEATLKAHPRVKALILNYPNNPIGNTYSYQQLKALANVIKKYPIFCLCDEIYSELTYGIKHVSMGTIIPDQTIVWNGASKTFAMTGWRVGLVCGPRDVMTKINGLNSDVVGGITSCAQYAASEGFAHGPNDGLKMRDVYEKRGKLLRDGLAKAGFTSPQPTGAFYIFTKIPSQYNQNSLQFAVQLAKDAKVGCIPGSSFGPGGEGHLRFSYATSTKNIKEAVKRIQRFVDTH